MKTKLLMKSLLVAAMLGGGMNAWADEIVLSPTGGVTTVATNSTTIAYSEAATSWLINQGSLTGGNIGKTAGPYCLVKFDATSVPGTITAASLSFDYASNAYNNNFIVYKLGAADWDATTVTWSTLSNSAKSVVATLGSGTWSTKNTTGTITYDITSGVSKSLMGMAICVNNAREQTISNIKLTITYTTATTYTATFTETNGLSPAVTIYTDAARTNTIANGTLLDATTYYYTATLAGYDDYEGSFTIAGIAPSVSFTMTAKALYTFTVNAVDGEGNILKTLLTDDAAYDGKAEKYYAPLYLTDTNNKVTYSLGSNTYVYNTQASSTPATITYTAFTGTAYYVEAEDVISATGVDGDNYSNGHAVRGFTKAKDVMTVLETGVYSITYAICNNNTKYDVSCTLSKNEDVISIKEGLQYVSANYIKTTGIVTVDDVVLLKNDILKLTPSSTNGIVDYMLIVRTGDCDPVSVTANTYGYQTFASDYALDFSSTTTKAYIATGLNGGSVTMQQVTKVPAGTGLFLQCSANEEIPVLTGDAEDVSANKLVRGTGAEVAKADGKDRYVLAPSGTSVAFFLINATAATISTSQAYLEVSAASGDARLTIDTEEKTGINAVESNVNAAEGYYNLNGQRVMNPSKGLYIVNGKKVIKK